MKTQIQENLGVRCEKALMDLSHLQRDIIKVLFNIEGEHGRNRENVMAISRLSTSQIVSEFNSALRALRKSG